MLSLKAAPVRWFLQLAGAQTDREVGVERLTLTAEKGHYLKPYARLLLAVDALRRKDTSKAREILTALTQQFPHNRLYVEELARLPVRPARDILRGEVQPHEIRSSFFFQA